MDISDGIVGDREDPQPAADSSLPEQLHGICPYCEKEKVGLCWDFFENVMQVAGKLVQLTYATCSCANCGKILNSMITGMKEAEVQPSGNFHRLHRH